MSGSGLYVLLGFDLEFDKVLCTCSFGIVATLIVRHVSLKLALSSLKLSDSVSCICGSEIVT